MSIRKPTRQLISEVARGNQRMITAFEQLWDAAGDSIPGKISALETDVDDLQTRMAAAESDIDALQTDVSDLKTRMSAAESDIGALQADVADLQSRVAALEAPRGIAGYSMAGPAVTTITAAATPVKIAGTTTADAAVAGFTLADNSATYSGTRVGPFVVSVSADISAGADTVALHIAINGVAVASASGTGHMRASYTVSLANGDVIEAWTENKTAANDVTVSNLFVAISEVA